MIPRHFLLGVLLAIPACQDRNHPPTYPVTGEVQFPNGKLLPEGALTLNSKGPHFLTVRGDITGGRFTVHTIYGEKKLPGAPAGKYNGSILVMEKDQSMREYAVNHEVEIKPEPNTLVLKVVKKKSP